jgi:hypothetical protein
MANSKSRDRNKPNSFSGERDAGFILPVLNSGALPGQERLARAAKARIVGVLDSIRDLFRKTEENPHWHLGEESNEEETIFHLAPEVSDALTVVNVKLKQYTSCSIFLPTLEGRRKWIVKDAIVGRHIVAEGQAIHALVRLADQGLLDRLRTCDCGVWYFARFAHQRFCSEECRVRFWETSEERKEKKRSQARANYLYRKTRKRR